MEQETSKAKSIEQLLTETRLVASLDYNRNLEDLCNDKDSSYCPRKKGELKHFDPDFFEEDDNYEKRA